jgi:hypothetical protein
VRSWHDGEHKLLPRFAAIIAGSRSAASRGDGESSGLDGYCELESEAKLIVSKMRESGNIVNTAVLRWVLRAVIDHKEPDLLNKLTLSNSFVQRWARQQMGWTWRRSTGAASKLPENWREEGCKMAKRIAILTETWEVSSRSHSTSCLAHSLWGHASQSDRLGEGIKIGSKEAKDCELLLPCSRSTPSQLPVGSRSTPGRSITKRQIRAHSHFASICCTVRSTLPSLSTWTRQACCCVLLTR